METIRINQAGVLQFQSFDGFEIEAALLKPAICDGESPLPLITLIHGGPTGAWEDTIETWGQLLAREATPSSIPTFAAPSATARNLLK